MNNSRFNLDELITEYYEGDEILGETECQHRSETSLYGDSWPGAQLTLHKMYKYQAKLKRCIKSLSPYWGMPVPITERVIDSGEAFDDIPF